MHYHRRGCGTAKCGGGDLLLWADYGLYRQVNGGWYQMNKEMDTIAIAYELAPGESRKLTLSWGELDWGGVLPAGTYCVAQGGLLGEQQVTVSVTFAIK